MAGDGKTPGTGSSSPFGDGQGGISGGRAAPFDQFAQSNPQKPTSFGSFPKGQIPASGEILKADPVAGSIRAAQIGTTAMNNRPSFRTRGA